MTDWHTFDAAAAASRLDTDVASGLDDTAAATRLARDGPNALATTRSRSWWPILIEQFATTMVGLLAVAAAVSFAVGDEKDAIAVLAIVVLNAALGFAQDYRAERALAALRKLAVPEVRVRRGGEVRTVEAHALVAGDVMLLDAGNVVAADARVVSAADLHLDESALTGEAAPVLKDADAVCPAATPLADRRNLVYMGTVVTHGRGVAIVTATGMRSELGRIASLVQTVSREATPLQRRLDRLGRGLAIGAVAIAAGIFVFGLVRGEPARLMFLTAVSVAVAAVPEGLPAVVTMALALGSQRMLRRQALVRRLSAVEALGSVDVICTDKTGTLTENRMSVAAIDLIDRAVDVSSPPAHDGQLGALLTAAALCNDATLDGNGRGTGDPTEIALLRGAISFGIVPSALAASFPRVGEAPFDAVRKRMSTVHRPSDAAAAPSLASARTQADETFVVCAKGAPAAMLAASSRVWTGDGIAAMNDAWEARVAAAADRLAADGMRVLGIAVRWTRDDQADAGVLERDMVLLGLVALADPARREAARAVAACRAAGIVPVMITGDHALTARAIATRVGIDTDGGVATGADVDAASEAELDTTIERTHVFARVAPEHKLRLVNAYVRRGHAVAMTGDGVNDAPALKQATIGVAMGVTGTDVAKEAADIVLLDDNFATIVAAVEEGRVIYDNVKKFVKYLLTTNSAELIVVALGPIVGLPLPLLPLQILWINLATDGPTALMLALEPAEPGVMTRPPAARDDIVSRRVVREVVWMGLVIAAVCLAAGVWYYRSGNPAWQTVVFTTVALTQQAHVLTVRAGSSSVADHPLTSNVPLLATVAAGVLLQFALIYVPAFQRVFDTVALPAAGAAVCLVPPAAVIAAAEAGKWLTRRNGPGAPRGE